MTETDDKPKDTSITESVAKFRASAKRLAGAALATLREAKGMNQSELARAVGVTPQAVQKWEAGTSAPRPAKLREVAAAVGAPYEALMVAFYSDSADPDLKSARDRAVHGMDKSATILQVHIADDGDTQVMKIPYYEAKASCGNGVIVFESGPKGHLLKEASFFTKYDIEPQDIIGVFADGNSNADFIVEGDIALFNRKKTEPRSGKLFLIDHPDGLRIKQLRRLVDGSWVMESRNPDKREYPDEIIHPSQAEALRIMGEFFYRQGG